MNKDKVNDDGREAGLFCEITVGRRQLEYILEKYMEFVLAKSARDGMEFSRRMEDEK